MSAYDHCSTDISQLSEEQYLDFRNCSRIREFTLSKTCDYDSQAKFRKAFFSREYASIFQLTCISEQCFKESSKMKADGFKYCVLENSSTSLEETLGKSYSAENIEER